MEVKIFSDTHPSALQDYIRQWGRENPQITVQHVTHSESDGRITMALWFTDITKDRSPR